MICILYLEMTEYVEGDIYFQFLANQIQRWKILLGQRKMFVLKLETRVHFILQL